MKILDVSGFFKRRHKIKLLGRMGNLFFGEGGFVMGIIGPIL